MSEKRDYVSRIKRSSPVGTATFIGLRSLDVFIQYGILAKDIASPLLDALNVTHVSSYAYSAAPAVAFGLPLKPLVILGMAVGTSIKQIFTIAVISQEEMPITNAVKISIFNTLFNSANSILSLTAAASYFVPSSLSANSIYEANETTPLFLAGTALYGLGLLIETGSEIQRAQFKKDPKNAGKPYTEGLFGLARHVNYGAYSLMRSSYGLASGGWIWGSIVGGIFLVDFAQRGVPVLDEYCTKRYGADWQAYKNKVTYKLIPGIY